MIATTDEGLYVVFEITNESYGIPVNRMIEVFQASKILKLPRVSPSLSGIVNLRGKILSVFDPSVLLWEVEKRPKLDVQIPMVLLVMVKDQEIGILIGNIPQLLEIQEFATKPPSFFKEKGIHQTAVSSQIGLLESKKEVYIIDLDSLLTGLITTETGIKVTSDEINDFDIDQFTLSEEPSAEKEVEFDLDQYTLPDDDVESEEKTKKKKKKKKKK